MARIDAFLKLGLAQGCSDIHLAVGVPPMLRMHGDLMPIKFRELGDTELESYVGEILTPTQKKRFEEGRDRFGRTMLLGREVGDPWMVALVHNNLGNATRGLGALPNVKRLTTIGLWRTS